MVWAALERLSCAPKVQKGGIIFCCCPWIETYSHEREINISFQKWKGKTHTRVWNKSSPHDKSLCYNDTPGKGKFASEAPSLLIGIWSWPKHKEMLICKNNMKGLRLLSSLKCERSVEACCLSGTQMKIGTLQKSD